MTNKPTKDYVKNATSVPIQTIDVDTLLFPKDRFQLLKIDHAIQWYTTRNKEGVQRRHVAVYVTLRCKKCGNCKTVKDTQHISCKNGLCNIRAVDLTGKTFGSLVVLRPALQGEFRKGRKTGMHWWVRCKCGCQQVTLQATLLKQGKITCSACSRQRTRVLNTLDNNMAAWHRLYKDYRNNAYKRSYAFDISFQSFFKISQSTCVYCGKQPQVGSYGIARNGIDRVDNTRGYTQDNIVACCGECNRLKGKLTVHEFLSHLQRIIDNQSQIVQRLAQLGVESSDSKQQTT